MIVVSISTIDSELGAEALALGAIDLVTKPTALASDRLYEIGDELVAKVIAAADGHRERRSRRRRDRAARSGRVELVMIGTSTGGPQALTRLLAALPATLDAPIAMVLHIPVGYTEALAARLDNGARRSRSSRPATASCSRPAWRSSRAPAMHLRDRARRRERCARV